MSDVSLAPAMAEAGALFFAGAGLGVFYFYGLWVTARRLPERKNPGRAAAGSFALRAALVLSGFYAAAPDGGFWGVLALVLGFTLARGFIMRLVISSGRALP